MGYLTIWIEKPISIDTFASQRWSLEKSMVIYVTRQFHATNNQKNVFFFTDNKGCVGDCQRNLFRWWGSLIFEIKPYYGKWNKE